MLNKRNLTMEKIVVLYGASHTGKTTTIVDVYNTINPYKTSPTRKQVGKNKLDFEDIVNYKGHTIAFLSAGDNRDTVGNAVDRFNLAKCDIMITAYNSGIAFLRSTFLSKSKQIIKVEKFTANNADNLRAMNEILSLI